MTLTTVAGDLVVDQCWDFGPSPVPGGSQTLIYNALNTGSLNASGSYQLATGISTTNSFTWTGGSTNDAIYAGAFQTASAIIPPAALAGLIGLAANEW